MRRAPSGRPPRRCRAPAWSAFRDWPPPWHASSPPAAIRGSPARPPAPPFAIRDASPLLQLSLQNSHPLPRLKLLVGILSLAHRKEFLIRLQRRLRLFQL